MSGPADWIFVDTKTMGRKEERLEYARSRIENGKASVRQHLDLLSDEIQKIGTALFRINMNIGDVSSAVHAVEFNKKYGDELVLPDEAERGMRVLSITDEPEVISVEAMREAKDVGRKVYLLLRRALAVLVEDIDKWSGE